MIRAHFTDIYFTNPANPITVNLIGAGGTGSHMLTQLAMLSGALNSLGHAGFQVNLWDDDIVTEANLNRQRFTYSEIGLNKAIVRVMKVNRNYGLNWKAMPERFQMRNFVEERLSANLTISCVDRVSTRFDIQDILCQLSKERLVQTQKPIYWMDLGNGQYNAQFTIATVKNVKQPSSKQFQTVDKLPTITREFKALLLSMPEDELPSCSQREALQKQDLFVNAAIAQQGSILLSNMLRNYMTTIRGVFMNLQDMTCVPVPV